MRTTLTIDDDLLSIARERADFQRRTVGEVISEMMRTAIAAPLKEVRSVNGLILLPKNPNARPVTLEHVNELRDEEEF